MKNLIANCNYAVLSFNDELNVVRDDEDQDDVFHSCEQFKGDNLELWKTREDGFHFVYCQRMQIGYWVHPRLVDIEITIGQ